MLRIDSKSAAALLGVIIAWCYATAPARSDPPHSHRHSEALRSYEAVFPDGRCMHYGACTYRSPDWRSPAPREFYPDGLRWNGEHTSLKFTGNRLKLRLRF